MRYKKRPRGEGEAICESQRLTQILYIFITSKGQKPSLLNLPASWARSISLEDDDTVCHGCGDECCPVGESSRSRAGVKSEVGEAIAKGAGQKGEMADKPGKSD